MLRYMILCVVRYLSLLELVCYLSVDKFVDNWGVPVDNLIFLCDCCHMVVAVFDIMPGQGVFWVFHRVLRGVAMYIAY